MTEPVHHALARRGLPPGEHAADSGYASADLLLAARARGITLLAPVPPDSSPQARSGGRRGLFLLHMQSAARRELFLLEQIVSSMRFVSQTKINPGNVPFACGASETLNTATYVAELGAAIRAYQARHGRGSPSFFGMRAGPLSRAC